MAKNRGRVNALTKRTVDAARPEAARYVVWDDKLTGFGLVVQPRNAEGKATKSYIVRYRVGGRRGSELRQKVIGRHGTVTPDQARVAAKRLLSRTVDGGDPIGDEIKTQQGSRTVAEVCEWYFAEAEAGRLLGRRGRRIKTSTLVDDRGRYNVHVKPLIGSRPVGSLDKSDIEKLRGDIAVGKTAVKLLPKKKRPLGSLPKGGSGVATRTVSMLNAIFEHAIRNGIIDDRNPARGIRKAASARRTRRLSLDEYRALGKALRASKETPTAVAALRLLAITGFRRNEVLGLRPEWLMEEGAINFPDTKSGAQVRPIGKAAVRAIKAQPKGEWVFPAERQGSEHFVGLPKFLARICKAAKLSGVTLHTFRHSFASTAADMGFSELVIAGLLGHSSGSVTARYVHLDSSLVAAADRVSAVIANALDGKEVGKVVALRGRA